MNAIFTNPENSKTSKPHVLILKLTDKIDLIELELDIFVLELLLLCLIIKV